MAGLKKVSLIKIITLLTVTLLISGCWDRRELEDQAFVQVMGIDKAPHNQILVTFRIAIPSKAGLGQTAGGGGGGEGSVAAQSSLLTSVIAPTIPSAVTLASGYVNRDLNLMHTKAIVLGEPFAREGIARLLGILTRHRELRGNVFMCVSEGEAYKLLEQNKPDLEKSFAKWWEGVKQLQSSQAIHPGSLLQDFITNAESLGIEGTMLYIAVNKEAKNQDPAKLKVPPSFEQAKLGVKSGEIPRTGGNAVEYVGTAVFKSDKLISVLTLTETRSLLMLNGQLRRAVITVEDPMVKGRYTGLEIKQGSPPNVKVNIDRDPVLIEEKLSLEGDLLALQSAINYATDLKNQRMLEAAIEKDLEEGALSVIKKLQQSGSDAVGYGDYASRRILTWPAWLDYDWPTKFKTAEVKVDVDFSIRRTGMLGKQPNVWEPR